jgi:acyl carrier protein
VRDILVSAWPHRFDPGQLRDEVPLGEDGLGLDSVEIVEIVVACEEFFEVPATEALFETTPLTIGRVVDYFRGRAQ